MARRTETRPTSAAPLELVVDALATYRLTRLATADIISEPIRRSIVGRALGIGGAQPEAGEETSTAEELVDEADDPPRIATLVTCRWCAGVWIAIGVTAARRAAPAWWDPASRALALSAAAVLIANLEDD